MKVENSVTPTQEQMAGFLAPGPDGPINMVNLLKFKDIIDDMIRIFTTVSHM